MSINVLGLFCEDIREEKSGQLTLVGIFPDNVSTPTRPENLPTTARAVMPKIALYMRVHIGVDDDVGPMNIKLVSQNGEELDLGSINEDLIARSRREAVANGLPIAGFINHAVMQGFQVVPGLLLGVVDIDGQRHTAAVLNFLNPQNSAVAKS